MKILALDTSSKNAIVAITNNEEKLIELINSDEKTHSQKLMPMIDEAFQKTNLLLNDIDLITCCLGPGSFTGVRIGIATAKAFADSKNIPVVGVSSLEELAYELNEEGYICSLIDAGHGNTYAGLFKMVKDEYGNLLKIAESLTFLSLQDENGKITEKNLLEILKNNIKTNKIETVCFVGDAATKYKELLENVNKQNLYKVKLSDERYNIASGITIARIGYTKYKNGEYGPSSVLSPVYLRKSQAELALEQKIKK